MIDSLIIKILITVLAALLQTRPLILQCTQTAVSTVYEKENELKKVNKQTNSTHSYVKGLNLYGIIRPIDMFLDRDFNALV